MKVKLADGEVLEVTVGEGEQEVLVAVKGSYHNTFRVLYVDFHLADKAKDGNAHFTLGTATGNVTRLTVFGHTTNINLPDFP